MSDGDAISREAVLRYIDVRANAIKDQMSANQPRLQHERQTEGRALNTFAALRSFVEQLPTVDKSR